MSRDAARGMLQTNSGVRQRKQHTNTATRRRCTVVAVETFPRSLLKHAKQKSRKEDRLPRFGIPTGTRGRHERDGRQAGSTLWLVCVSSLVPHIG